MSDSRSFKVGVDFESVLRAISKQIYETPLAFIRENVQNAVDAIRIQASRDEADPAGDVYRIEVTADERCISVRDNGTGMSLSDLEHFFWTIGASGKRTPEAIAAGCVGIFGIGGFANFGVCETLEVVSQTDGQESGTLTRLSREDIKSAGGAIPAVYVEDSAAAGPRGTVVVGQLREPARLDQLRRYLQDFVRYVPTSVYFNGRKLSQNAFSSIEDQRNLREVRTGTLDWTEGDLVITGRLYEDRGHTIVAAIRGLSIAGERVNLSGHLRFEGGTIDVFKRGFKLCATSVGTTIGVTGRLDCDRFMPTAGRDSLDAPTTSLVSRIVLALERVAVEAALATPERIGQHTRVFRYVIRHGMVEMMDNVTVRLADGSESSLGDIRRRAAHGKIGVFYGVAQKQALNQIMQARGHLVILLSADRHRLAAEQQFLERYCNAKPFDGIVDCVEHYEHLSRFEKVVLSELEVNVSKSYEVKNFRLVPGKLTEDVPVFVREYGGGQAPDIIVDVRHAEIAKLKDIGFSQVLYSLIAAFCREYLGPSLKKWSPRFFGDGALNLELLAKRRSELWVLLKDDIGIVRKGGHRYVVTSSDVEVVSVGAGRADPDTGRRKPRPRILQIVEDGGSIELAGHYIRMPESAFEAYGDLLPECESRGVVWAGNKILYVASDTVSAAFQYEIRLDEVVAGEVNGELRAEGALPLQRPLQEVYGGLYFPIPVALEPFLVPRGEAEVRLEVHCDWIDMRTSKHWTSRSTTA